MSIPVAVQYWAVSARNLSHDRLHVACPGSMLASPGFLLVSPEGDPFLPTWIPLIAQNGNQHLTVMGNLNHGLHFPQRESLPHWWLASPHTSSWNKIRQNKNHKFLSQTNLNRTSKRTWDTTQNTNLAFPMIASAKVANTLVFATVSLRPREKRFTIHLIKASLHNENPVTSCKTRFLQLCFTLWSHFNGLIFLLKANCCRAL